MKPVEDNNQGPLAAIKDVPELKGAVIIYRIGMSSADGSGYIKYVMRCKDGVYREVKPRRDGPPDMNLLDSRFAEAAEELWRALGSKAISDQRVYGFTYASDEMMEEFEMLEVPDSH